MKIIYSIDVNPINGGAPISTVILANVLSVENDVSIIMPKNKSKNSIKEKIHKIEMHDFNEYFPFILQNPLKAIKLVKSLSAIITENKADIIHAHMPRSGRAIGCLRILNKLDSDTKLIYTDREHVADLRKIYRPLYNFFIANKYDAIICISEKSAVYWRKRAKRALVTVIPNTAGLQYENYDVNMHKKERYRLNINVKQLTIMFAGRMVSEKNWKLAVEIIRKLSNSDIHIIIAISFNHDYQVKEYNNMKKELTNFENNITWFENLPQSEINKLYYAADIFILTSNYEAFGRTAIEAMSRKCIVLGRNVGGLPEVILKKENILNNSPEEFVDRILEYKKNEQKLESDKIYFYDRFINNYTVEKYEERHLSLYRTLLKENSCNI